MKPFPTHLPRLLAILVVALATSVALPACGDDEESSSDSSAEQPKTSAGDASGAAPSPASVLKCLKGDGVDASDQSSNTSGQTIGIDYPGGRTVISFEESVEDAETLESVSQSQSTGDTFRSGLIVVSAADDPDASGDRSSIESCIEG